MKKIIYAVHDSVVGEYNTPFLCNSQELAIRMIVVAAQRDDSVRTNPDDYTLWCLGEMDTESGVIESQKPTIVRGPDLFRNIVAQARQREMFQEDSE